MLDIGSKIMKLRKDKKMSQSDLANAIGTSRVMIGNYERNENMPSIEIVLKIAKLYNVSVDFIVGEGLNASYDKEMIKRLEHIEKLPQDKKDTIFNYIDLVIRDFRTGQAYS